MRKGDNFPQRDQQQVEFGKELYEPLARMCTPINCGVIAIRGALFGLDGRGCAGIPWSARFLYT